MSTASNHEDGAIMTVRFSVMGIIKVIKQWTLYGNRDLIQYNYHCQCKKSDSGGDLWHHPASQIAKAPGSKSIRYQFDAKVSDGYVVDVDPRVFAICDWDSLFWQNEHFMLNSVLEPYIITAVWHWYKSFIQRQHSIEWKLCCDWLGGLS